jgi:hypothetical protein
MLCIANTMVFPIPLMPIRYPSIWLPRTTESEWFSCLEKTQLWLLPHKLWLLPHKLVKLIVWLVPPSDLNALLTAPVCIYVLPPTTNTCLYMNGSRYVLMSRYIYVETSISGRSGVCRFAKTQLSDFLFQYRKFVGQLILCVDPVVAHYLLLGYCTRLL